MKVIGRHRGRLGEIVIWENQTNDTRFYLEGEIFQSHATPTGESQFTKMMESFLAHLTNVLLLGCGGGNLGTMLTRSGKTVTVVDHNPSSFDIAREYFRMPDGRTFRLKRSNSTASRSTLGAPDVCFEEQFDSATCYSIKSRLTPGGRISMNMLVASDSDPAPDKIGSQLSDHHLDAWIFDQPGFRHRNAWIACLAKREPGSSKRHVAEVSKTDQINFTPRRSRRRSSRLHPISIKIRCSG
jgi:hypothetical protein